MRSLRTLNMTIKRYPEIVFLAIMSFTCMDLVALPVVQTGSVTASGVLNMQTGRLWQSELIAPFDRELTERELILVTLNTTENPRQIALELLRQHGKAASAFQILESGYRFWFFEPGGVRSGVVAYRVCNGCAVVVGQPVCRDAELKLCVAEFMSFLRRSNLNLLMVGVEAWALGYLDLKAQGLEAFKIGEQPEWACQDYSLQASTRRSLRTQVNRARNKGVEVRALSRQENNQLYPAQKLAIEHILARWMERRPIAILKFMVNLEPLSNSSEKLYFLAEREGEPIGFLAAVPVFGRQGWFLRT